MAVPVHDVDMVVIAVCGQDPPLAVCSDAGGMKGGFGGGGTGVSEAEFPGGVHHHYCPCFVVGHADIKVPVLCDMFSATVGVQWLVLEIVLYAVLFSGASVTYDLGLGIVITVHDNEEVPRGGTAYCARFPRSEPPIEVDGGLCL